MEQKVKTIIWKDASGCRTNNQEWFDLDEAIKVSAQKYKEDCITAGIIIENNKNYIVVASTKSSDNLYSDITMIPKKFLIKIK